MGVFVEIGLTLFEEGVAALLGLVHGVVEHGGVAGQLLDARLAIEFGIEARLNHSESERRVFHHALSPRHAGIFKLGQRHNLIDEPHLECLLGGIFLAEEPNLPRLLLPDDAREI